MLNLSNNTNRNGFAKTEVLLVASSIGSSIAAIIFQQVAFAAITSIPLSLAIGLNSSHRKRLESVEQQHKASIIQLEQNSNKQEFINEVLYSLPTRAELADIESRLEVYNSAKTEQLHSLTKQQNNIDLELHQIDNYHRKVAAVYQQLYVLENLLQLDNSDQLRTELQENLVRIEAKIRKLEQQFNNLPISGLQHQLLEVQELVNKLQVNSTESTQLYKCVLGEIQFLSQQVQSLNTKTQELSLAHTEIQSQLNLLQANDTNKISEEIKLLLSNDLETNVNIYTEVNQNISEEVKDLRQQIQTISSSVSEKIKTLQLEIQSKWIFIEKSEQKIHEDLYELADWHNNLEVQLQKVIAELASKTSTKVEKPEIKVLKRVCDYCHQNYQAQPIQGGHFLNYSFCCYDCRKEYEKRNC